METIRIVGIRSRTPFSSWPILPEKVLLRHQLKAGQAEVRRKRTIPFTAGGHDLCFYPPFLFLLIRLPKGIRQCLQTLNTHIMRTLPRMTSFSDAPTLFYSLFCIDALEKARTPIGESRAVALLVQIEALNKQRLSHVDIQALRVLANICVDHGNIRLNTLYSGRSSSFSTCLSWQECVLMLTTSFFLVNQHRGKQKQSA